MCDSLQCHGLFSPWDFPGKNTGVGCHFLLQGLFFLNKYLLINLATPGRNCKLGIFSCGMWTLSCSMWDLVPCPGIEPGASALGARSLSHWTTGDVPQCLCLGFPSFPHWLTYSFIFLQLVERYFFSGTCVFQLDESEKWFGKPLLYNSALKNDPIPCFSTVLLKTRCQGGSSLLDEILQTAVWLVESCGGC